MKKIYVIVLFLIMIFLTSCWKAEEKEIQKVYKTIKVQTWTIDSYEWYIWYAKWITEVSLSTKSNWKITFLKSKIWDKVKSGDLLVTLDSLEAKVWYNVALNVIWSLDSLKEYTSLSYDEQIKVLEKKIEEIEQTKNILDTTTKNIENVSETELISWELSIKQAETQLETAKNELEQAEKIYLWNKQDIFSVWKNVILNSVILDTNIINFTDSILWITDENKDKNNSYEIYLWAKNSDILNQTEESFRKTNNLYLEYKKYYEDFIENKDSSNDQILEWMNKWLEVAEKIKEMLNLFYKTIDNSVESTYLTKTTLDQYRKSISDFWRQIESNILSYESNTAMWLKWTKETLDSLERNYSKEKVLLDKKIEIAEDNLNTTIQSLDKIKANTLLNIESEQSKKIVYDKQVEWIKAQIESIKLEKEAKLKDLDSNITKIEWEKSSAWVQIQNWNIYSPINWIILEKLAEVWEVTWAWKTVYVVWDNSKIKINIDVLTEKLSNLKLWDLLNIKFDWIEQLYKWEIINIPQLKDTDNKKTTIEIVVNNKDWIVNIWSIAKVYFPNEKNNYWLIISNQAILQKFWIPWVYLLKDWKAIFTKIEIIKQNNDFSEIKWLKIWDIVISEWKENIYDWEFINYSTNTH